MSCGWRRSLGPLSILYSIFWLIGGVEGRRSAVWTAGRRQLALNRTKDLWYHGFNNYMQHAFPMDELRPLSCMGRGPDWENPENYGNNDVAANVSMTLIDVLDTFVALEDHQGFENAVRNVIEHVTFDVDTKPQVFEITIRVLGGLISGHIYASDPSSSYRIPWYRGQLLRLAHNLGERLLPAFRTSTGIPYARTNLRSGVPKGESVESCAAGAGSLIIEFSILSRLTGDDRFEKAATKAFFAIWNRRSDINLIGNTINIWTGSWTPPLVGGIGAGIDSFYEYALKWYIISGEVEYLDVFQEAYAAIMRYARSPDGLWFHSVAMTTGDRVYTTVDSLSSFWPGLQVLAGDVENAIKSHLFYWNLWKRHSGMPEVFDVNFSKAVALQYPIRPEFIESTYYLYRATKDPFYLDVGERVLQDITLRTRVDCGLASILDLSNNTQDDRMESFVLSETIKYLALLFDEDNPVHRADSNTVFTTEGHLVFLNSSHIKPISAIRREIRRGEHNECPEYDPWISASPIVYGLAEGIQLRTDFEWARHLIVAPLRSEFQSAIEFTDEPFWHPYGWCEVPKSEVYSYDFILSSDGSLAAEDTSPGPQKVAPTSYGYLVNNVTGIRAHIVSRIDARGYDITQLGPHAVRGGQKVHVNDSLFTATIFQNPVSVREHVRDVLLFFRVMEGDQLPEEFLGMSVADKSLTLRAFTASFGADFGAQGNAQEKTRLSSPNLKLLRDIANPYGCQPYSLTPISITSDDILVVDRGDCSFVEKLRSASKAGAAGVIVISDEDDPMNASKDPAEVVDDLADSGLLVLTRSSGEALMNLMEIAQKEQTFVAVAVEQEVVVEVQQPPESARAPANEEELPADGEMKYIYLGGKPIMNMIILV